MANIGLQDRKLSSVGDARTCSSRIIAERQALRWVQKYISAFNGDPTKVTM